MELKIEESLFKELYPLILNDDITDIKWNGRQLWINDLKKGRYPLKDIVLEEEFLNILTTKIANSVNENFNRSKPHLSAETDELRFHAIHSSAASNTVLSIRKTPSVCRIKNETIVESGYMDGFLLQLLPALIRAHCSIIIIGDVGSGKTEFEKWLAQFIPSLETITTVEDTLEMKLPVLYPEKDVYSVKITPDYSSEQAIRDALRQLTKWLLIAESRGREILTVVEGASTGCKAITTIHCDDVSEIPDRVVQMAGNTVDAELFENDVYTFFDVGIHISSKITNNGIIRNVDQLCFFDRTNKKNILYKLYDHGDYNLQFPEKILRRFKANQETELLKKIRKGGSTSEESKEKQNFLQTVTERSRELRI